MINGGAFESLQRAGHTNGGLVMVGEITRK